MGPSVFGWRAVNFQYISSRASGIGELARKAKGKVGKKKAVTFMIEHPALTLKRSILKYASFWGLERTVIGGFRLGYYNPPHWLQAAVSLGIPIAYILVMGFGLFWRFFDRTSGSTNSLVDPGCDSLYFRSACSGLWPLALPPSVDAINHFICSRSFGTSELAPIT